MPWRLRTDTKEIPMKFLAAACCSIWIAAFSVAAHAGTSINNVVMEVDPSGRATTEVTNIGDEPMGYVLTPLEWSVDEGEDTFTETAQFMAVPPSFQLAPGQKMTVRVGFRNATSARVERTFRLSVREVPTTVAEEGLAFAFNHMLPVYIAPAGGREPTKLDWSLVRSGGGWSLRASNGSNTRAVMRSLVIDGTEVPTSSKATILARSWREYPVPAAAVSGGTATVEYNLLSGGSDTIVLSYR
jgi:fimbrial chaperone protein